MTALVPASLELPGGLYIVHEDSALLDGWCVRSGWLYYNKKSVGKFVNVVSQDAENVYAVASTKPVDTIVHSTTVNAVLKFE